MDVKSVYRKLNRSGYTYSLVSEIAVTRALALAGLQRRVIPRIQRQFMAGMSQKVFCDSDALFTHNGIAPVQDGRGDRELILMYPLPDSAQRIASLCSEVLASGYGVADDEPLLFTLIQYP